MATAPAGAKPGAGTKRYSLKDLNGLSDVELIDGIGSTEVAVSGNRRQQLRFIREFDLRERWQQDGARHMGQWLAAHLSFEKVLQLARYLEADSEEDEIRWARKARLDEIKRKADVANRPILDDVQLDEVSRYLSLYDDRYGNLNMSGRMPAAEGALFRAAIDEMRKHIPVPPDEEPDEERQGLDALLALTVGRGGAAGEPQRATVVVHADLDALVDGKKGAEIEGGGVIAPEVASRMLCDADLETVVHDSVGNVVGIGRASRQVPSWMRRQLIKRDGGCTFPGCGTKRFLNAHHVVHWESGGNTDLSNLTLVCHFHHKLVHEFGWGVRLDEAQSAVWLRPDGTHFVPTVRATSPPAIERGEPDVDDPSRTWGFQAEWLRPVRFPGAAAASGFG